MYMKTYQQAIRHSAKPQSSKLNDAMLILVCVKNSIVINQITRATLNAEIPSAA